MQEPRDNVVRFQPRPKKPPPKPAPRRPSHERAINWSKAPKALVVIALFVLAMMLFSGLAGLISNIGVG